MKTLHGHLMCDLCQQREADKRYREVTGWEQLRLGPRKQLHGLIKARATGRHICTECMQKLKADIPLGQQSLFEGS